MKRLLHALILTLFISQCSQSQNLQLWGLCHFGGVANSGTIFTYSASTGTYNNHYDFLSDSVSGANPFGSLIQGSDGLMYGMTGFGGTAGDGVIFSFNSVTNTYTNLYCFAGDSNSGSEPYGNLLQASNGLLYGITYVGGSSHDGVLFSFNPSGNVYNNLYTFSDDINSGARPVGSLIQLPNNLLYGMTADGGDNNSGAIFSFDPATNTYLNHYSFIGGTNNGAYPEGNLLLASNGLLYGMTNSGGANSTGTIFSFNGSTNTYTNLYSFLNNDTSAANPFGSFIQANNGLLYGMAGGGGAYGKGAIFSFNPVTNIYTHLYNFAVDSNSGGHVYGSLLQAPNGLLYGLSAEGGANQDGVIFSFDTQTNSYTNLYNFTSNGYQPYGNFLLLSACAINRDTLTLSICQGDTAYLGTGSYTLAGTYIDTLANTGGCDSVVTLMLTVNAANLVGIIDTICSGDTVYVGTHAHYSVGNYVDTLTNVGGCDSIVTLGLTIRPAPAVPTITVQGHTLQSSPELHYRWFFNGVVIPGDTNASILATQNGNYSVQSIGANGCVSNSLDYDDTLADLPVPAIGSDSAYNTANYMPPSILMGPSYCGIPYNGRNLIFINKSLNADSVVWNVTQLVCYWSYSNFGYSCDSFANCQDTIMHGDTIALLPWFNDSDFYSSCGQGSVNNLIVCLTAYNQYGSISECDTTCQILYNVAINEVPSAKISLYPNPTTDLLYIKTEGIQPQTTNIYDVNGQLVSTMRFAPQVDVSKLTPGVYLMEVTAPEGEVRRRFVKM